MFTRYEREEFRHLVYNVLADLHYRSVHERGSFTHLCVLNIGGQEVDVFTHHPVGLVINEFGSQE